MAKPRTEKEIKIGQGKEFPIDLWSVGIDLLTFKTIGPVLALKKGSIMSDAGSYVLYTIRTRKEMTKNGYSTMRIGEKLFIVAMNVSDCKNGLNEVANKLITQTKENIIRLRQNVFGDYSE